MDGRTYDHGVWASVSSALMLAGERMVSGVWDVSDAVAIPDGTYEIRVETNCGSKTGVAEFDASYTTTVIGVIDRVVPELVSVISTSGTSVLTAGDVVTVSYTETVHCDALTFASITFGANRESGAAVFDSDNNKRLRFGCDGNEVRLALVDPTPAELSAGAVSVLVNNVADVSGNMAEDAVAIEHDGLFANPNGFIQSEVPRCPAIE